MCSPASDQQIEFLERHIRAIRVRLSPGMIVSRDAPLWSGLAAYLASESCQNSYTKISQLTNVVAHLHASYAHSHACRIGDTEVSAICPSDVCAVLCVSNRILATFLLIHLRTPCDCGSRVRAEYHTQLLAACLGRCVGEKEDSE